MQQAVVSEVKKNLINRPPILSCVTFSAREGQSQVARFKFQSYNLMHSCKVEALLNTAGLSAKHMCIGVYQLRGTYFEVKPLNVVGLVFRFGLLRHDTVYLCTV